jgi:hypothetical protein
MSDTVKRRRNQAFRMDLDRQIVALPGRSLNSIMGLLAHLEGLAIRKERATQAVTSQGQSAKTWPTTPKPLPFDEVRPEGLCLRDLGRQLIRAARSQVQVLRARTQEIQALVLINGWTVAERLWAELLPECKTPLFELNFLEELWGINPERLEVDGWTLTRHWHQFVLIQAEVEILLGRRQNPVQLSDALEGHLGGWLERFDEILEKLDEESVA